MKVLVCHNHYQRPGGEDRVFADETALLEAHGHEVVRFTRHNDDVAGMGRLALARATFGNRDAEAALDALIAAERPDVMHCHNTFPLISPSAYRAARRHGVAVVQTLHNFRLVCPKAELMRDGQVCEECLGRPFAWPAIRHACYRNSRQASGIVAAMMAEHRRRGTWREGVDRYVTPTAFVKRKFVEGGLPAERIAVKPNFVAGTPRTGDGAGGYVVFVGRLSTEKGVRCLLEAWERLSDDIELRILGDGPMSGDVRAAAEHDRRIAWLGHRTPDEVLETIGQARLLVMPSIWYETFGLCIAEAYAVGTPVVASRLGAMEELVDPGRTGFLFTAGDAGALARTVRDAHRMPDVATGMRRLARARYEEAYSAKTNLALLLRVYEEAIASRREALA